VRDVGKVLFSS